ncbi:MAG: translation initiation factor IF-2 [Desulfovibrionaceae bacterium]|nr:translation initiation factor IF-2 [Desulfovibrionaceae bacterium]
MRRVLAACLLGALTLGPSVPGCGLNGAGPALAASALSAPRSGLEAPGGPRPLDRLPAAGRSSGTLYGNPGYTDAYGNTVDDVPPPEKAPRKRLAPGAYGAYGSKSEARPLPDPANDPRPPAWSFQ